MTIPMSQIMDSRSYTINRRSFLSRAALLAAGSACFPLTALGKSALLESAGSARAFSASIFNFTILTPGIAVIAGGGGNAVVYYDNISKQALLSDCKNPHLGFTLRRRIEAEGYHLEKVINTHHHLDHSGGNYAFNHDLELVGHHNLTPRVTSQVDTAIQRARASIESLSMEEFSADREEFDLKVSTIDAADFVPDIEMTTPEMEVNLNETHSVELRHVTPGHTDNDIFLRFPEQNVIHTGDLLFHESHPFIDVSAGASTRGWQKSVNAMIKLCDADTKVVPGHGDMTDVSGLKRQVAYFNDLRSIVKEARKSGQSRDEIATFQPEIFAKLKFERLQARNLGVMFDELEQEG